MVVSIYFGTWQNFDLIYNSLYPNCMQGPIIFFHYAHKIVTEFAIVTAICDKLPSQNLIVTKIRHK